MNSTTCDIDDLAKAIADSLASYTEECSEETKAEVKKIGKECAKRVRDNIKTCGINDPNQRYERSWTCSVRSDRNSNEITCYIHSKNRYQVAHLLENGHQLRNGGRARAFVHIKPAEEWAVKELEKTIKVVWGK